VMGMESKHVGLENKYMENLRRSHITLRDEKDSFLWSKNKMLGECTCLGYK
jgi:hypothetical protein